MDLEQNVLASLDAVPLESMCRSVPHPLINSSTLTVSLSFSTRSRRFMDAYRKGLTGAQAAWANKKYRGHRVLPEGILTELGTAKIN